MKETPSGSTEAEAREKARRAKVRDLLKFEGKMHWEGDLDALRRRKEYDRPLEA